jgi:acetyl esterase/lipase
MPSEQIAQTIRLLRQIGPLDVDAMTVQEMRMIYDQVGDAYPAGQDITVEEMELGGIKAEKIYCNKSDVNRAIIYFHGGGYVIGSLQSHRELASRIATAADGAVYLIDYPLAPENPFPAAVESAKNAYRDIAELGVPVGVAGDSAGGGLALALLIALRDEGVTTARAAALLSPWLDLTLSGESLYSRAERDPVAGRAQLVQWVSYYLNGLDPKLPLASPLFADLSGLPPIYIQVGTEEVLYDDSRRLAELAPDNVVLDDFDGCMHVFQQFSPDSPEAVEALDRLGNFFKTHLA